MEFIQLQRLLKRLKTIWKSKDSFNNNAGIPHVIYMLTSTLLLNRIKNKSSEGEILYDNL
jgi:UDP-N-acetylmuramyl pentapeptide synthase